MAKKLLKEKGVPKDVLSRWFESEKKKTKLWNEYRKESKLTEKLMKKLFPAKKEGWM